MEYEEMLDSVYKKVKKGEVQERMQIVTPKITFHGKKTIIANFEQFCNSINREVKQVAKFLYKELATSGAIENGKLVLQTKNPLTEDKIKKYMKNFVYCSECGKPDTIIKKEDRYYIIKCEACGARKTLSL